MRGTLARTGFTGEARRQPSAFMMAMRSLATPMVRPRQQPKAVMILIMRTPPAVEMETATELARLDPGAVHTEAALG